MKHLIQKPGEHNCLIYSMAMLLNMEVKELESRLGNWGNEKVWPELPDPYCYRSYHIQEIIEVAYQLGFAMICFNMDLTLSPTPPYTGAQIPINITHTQVKYLLNSGDALLITNNHALAWNGSNALDPNGRIRRLDEIYDSLIMFFLIKSI